MFTRKARVVLQRENQVLFIGYPKEDASGQHFFTFPGGGCDVAEHPAETAARELAEETGILADVLDMRNGYMFQDFHIPTNMSITFYHLRVGAHVHPIDQEDSSALFIWSDIHSLDPRIPMDACSPLIYTAYTRLR